MFPAASICSFVKLAINSLLNVEMFDFTGFDCAPESVNVAIVIEVKNLVVVFPAVLAEPARRDRRADLHQCKFEGPTRRPPTDEWNLRPFQRQHVGFFKTTEKANHLGRSEEQVLRTEHFVLV